MDPDDFVIADGSGIVFIKNEKADRVLDAAEEIFAREQLMAEAIGAGTPIGEVLGADYEDMLKGK